MTSAQKRFLKALAALCRKHKADFKFVRTEETFIGWFLDQPVKEPKTGP